MLPKIEVPIYDLNLLSTGQKVKFRPFTVKEEKLFLMAAEANDAKSIIDTVKQIVNNCLIDKINVDELPIFDIENIFINLRSKSVGEIVNLRYKCNNKIQDVETKEEKTCNNLVEVDVNLNEIISKEKLKKDNKIEITENLGIVMNYPSLKILSTWDGNDENSSILETVVSCIDFIYDKENIYYAKDTPKEELVEFIESMQTKDLDKIKDFFDSAPKLRTNIHFKCPKCNYEENVLVEGLESFFV